MSLQLNNASGILTSVDTTLFVSVFNGLNH
ncbi:Uncharacterised protein [Vibrio cholerae]|nr:Uncharacterised protein [Vibrio cholerae]